MQAVPTVKLKRGVAAVVAAAGLGLTAYFAPEAPLFAGIATAGSLSGAFIAAFWVRRPSSRLGLGTVLVAALAGSFSFLLLGRFDHLEDAAFFLWPLNLGVAALWWAITGHQYENRSIARKRARRGKP